MIDDFLKRLFWAVAYWMSAMCVIHIMMATDPGYQGNWLYIFTGKIVWLIALILKLGFIAAFAVGVFYLIGTAIQIQDSRQEHKAEEDMKNNNKEISRPNEAQAAVVASAREFEAVAEKKRKEKEFEEHRQKRHLEKYGPRSEEDALAKAMDSLKFGGLE